jgi:SAM-dependent methyltransferase
MEFNDLKKHWNHFGQTDPLWAILTEPSRKGGKWDAEEFFRTGRDEIDTMIRAVQAVITDSSLAAEVNFRIGPRDSFQRDRRKSRALDFGCGVGRLTQALCGYFDECHGVDIARSMIQEATRLNRFGERCIYHLNERSDLELFSKQSFDFIYSNIVLQHMEPRFSRKYISEFVRLLAPGGILVFQIPSALAGTIIDRPLPNDAFAAEISAVVDGVVIESGSDFCISLRIRNCGRTLWPAGGLSDGKYQVLVGDHWLTPNGEMLLRDHYRACLPKDVAPGEDIQISFGTKAAMPPGRYIVEIDLVQEAVAWFGNEGSPTLRIPIWITEKTGPRQTPGEGVTSASTATDFKPLMEMYGINRSEVLSLLESSGARVLRAEKDHCAPGWEGFRYYATRPALTA